MVGRFTETFNLNSKKSYSAEIILPIVHARLQGDTKLNQIPQRCSPTRIKAKISIMERLPTERLTNISESLSDKDILNLPSHIISHTLTDTQAHKMLQRLDVWLERSSLERLNRIGRHPNLAKHVKEVRFYNERLDDVSREAYLKSFWITNHGKMHCGMLEKLSFSNYRELAFKGNPSVEECFTRYRKQLEDQKRMEEQREDVLLLYTAFSHLPNLEKVSIDNKNRFELLDVLGDAWCCGVEQKSFKDCGSHLLDVLFRGMSKSTRKIASFEVLHQHDARLGNDTSTVSFPAMISKLPPNNISSAVQNLRSFKLKNVYYGYHEIVFHDAVREESCGNHWTRKADENAKHETTEAIAEMLSSAPLLEHLTLKFYKGRMGRCEPSLTPYMPLQSMRGSNDLQQLERLSLAKFKTREDQLVPFLLGVAGTVTYIHIDGIVLESGSWLSAFSQLRGKLLKLERFKVGFDALYEAKLGPDGTGTNRFGCIVKASDVQVSTIGYRQFFDVGDKNCLGWFKDGTGWNPIALASHRRGSSGGSGGSDGSDDSDQGEHVS